MYSPLNEDYMFQEMHDRMARVTPRRAKDTRDDSVPNRRWWQRGRRVAR